MAHSMHAEKGDQQAEYLVDSRELPLEPFQKEEKEDPEASEPDPAEESAVNQGLLINSFNDQASNQLTVPTPVDGQIN